MARDEERSNVMEVLLSDGSSLYLAADSLTQCQEWLQSLCTSVSQQMGVSVEGDNKGGEGRGGKGVWQKD